MKYVFTAIMAALTLSTSHAKTCDWCVHQKPAIKEELLELAKKQPKEILERIRAQKICVKVLSSSRKHPDKLFHWGKIEPGTDNLSVITSNAALMGKTACKGEHERAKDCTTIFLASDAPLSTLFHEYLHTKQIEKDGKWCDISKKLWLSKPTPKEEIEIRNKEWDVVRLLWENRDGLGFGIEDKVSLADAIINEAKAREKFDKSAAKYIEAEKAQAKLMEYISQYMKQITGP